VSNLGRVKSVERRARVGGGRTRLVRERILRPGKINKYGHLAVNLSKNNQPEMYQLHHLVLEAFIGTRPKIKSLGLHRNDDPSNNRADNLYWGTMAENAQDSLKNGGTTVGERNYNAKSTNEEVRKVRKMYSTGNYTVRQLAEIFSMKNDKVRDIVKFKKWKHI
jgi:hypothetical protein